MLLRWLPVFALLTWAWNLHGAETVQRVVSSGGLERTYRLHIPGGLRKARTVPLVIAFHGSGADGAAMERFTHFSKIADREGFIVAYPDAVKHEWNDGRGASAIPSQAANVDDVAFVDAMITQIGHEQSVDDRRVFATGFSNGGIFAHYLGAKLSDRLAAIAPVSGGLAEPMSRSFKPAAAISVCIIHGAADKLVPFGGGNVDMHDNGRIIATEQSIGLWKQQDGVFAAPTTSVLSESTQGDHRRVKLTRWHEPKKATEVVLYTIEDGGHAWPVDANPPRFLAIWHGARSFDATDVVWKFFKTHPKA